MDISADRKTVVTGQVGNKPTVHVWNVETLEKVCQFECPAGSRGISAVSVSPCSRYVACVDLHNDHRVTIYNVQRDKLLLHTQSGTDKILDVAWSKRPEDLRFATVSPKGVTFWHPADVTKRLKQPGVMGKTAATALTCIDFDEEGWCYTGGDNGQIHAWADNCTVAKAIKAHGAGITGITATGGKLISGGKDKRICIITAQGGSFKLDKFIDFSSSFPRSIDFLNGHLLVGLRNGTVTEFRDVLTTENPAENTLIKSHFEGEVWGLELIPETNTVVTCGDDNQIMVYDYESKNWSRKGNVSDHKSTNQNKLKSVTASSMSIYPANQQARAICYSKKHNHLVVCSNMGKVSVRDFTDLEKKICGLKDATEWCEVAKYSPCETMLAVGSHDNNVYVYKIDDDGKYTLYTAFKKFSSFVTALDWSQDSSYIRAQDGAYDKLYFKIDDKSQDTSGLSNTKDLEWATCSLKLGWDVQGIHPASEDGTHINGVVRSAAGDLLVSTDDWGLMNVYNYPVCDYSHQPRSYSGHSEHVVRAAFTPDGSRLFTIGGQDKALIQWRKKQA